MRIEEYLARQAIAEAEHYAKHEYKSDNPEMPDPSTVLMDKIIEKMLAVNTNHKRRVMLDKIIPQEVCKALLEKGYMLAIHGGGESEPDYGPGVDLEQIKNALFQCDDDTVCVYRQQEGPGGHQGWVAIGWVRFVYGNSGYDVVSDYTINLDDPVDKISQQWFDNNELTK